MSNEETIIMQSQNTGKTKQTTNNETSEKVKKADKEKNAAVTATAAAVGGAVGSGAAYAATTMLHDKDEEAEEQKPQEEAQTTEEPVAEATEEQAAVAVEEPKKEEHHHVHKEEVADKVDENTSEESDYTGYNGADPVMQNPDAHPAVDESNGSGNNVQVLGIYEAQNDNGQTMQTALLTNGEDLAAVIDVNNDGMADVLVVDENHNLRIDEGEVYDLSDDHVQMADYQQSYLAQQQEQIQQEHETFAYNASNDQSDYNNNAEPEFT